MSLFANGVRTNSIELELATDKQMYLIAQTDALIAQWSKHLCYGTRAMNE